MADIYDDPIGALRELHDSFRQAALEQDSLSPMRIAATQRMLDQLVANDSSQGVREELEAIKKTSFQASREIRNSMAWTFLTEMCEKLVLEIDEQNRPQTLHNNW